VDYTRLSELLQAGQWKEADRETADRMCEVMGRQAGSDPEVVARLKGLLVGHCSRE
jgi:hypothetical protein